MAATSLEFAYSFGTTTSGSVCWGHDTDVVEDNIRDFSGNWTGTGSIEGSDDEEIIRLYSGQYMESEVVEISGNVEILVNNYGSGSGENATLEYRTGSDVDLSGESYVEYSAAFASGGYVQIKVSR